MGTWSLVGGGLGVDHAGSSTEAIRLGGNLRRTQFEEQGLPDLVVIEISQLIVEESAAAEANLRPRYGGCWDPATGFLTRLWNQLREVSILGP